MEKDLDRELEKAQAALLAQFAPDARVGRIRWSQGGTQLFDPIDFPADKIAGLRDAQGAMFAIWDGVLQD